MVRSHSFSSSDGEKSPEESKNVKQDESSSAGEEDEEKEDEKVREGKKVVSREYSIVKDF